MPRFVILEHDHPELHWDFMLEMGATLKTWRLSRAPDKVGERMNALPLEDHRVFYLDYEGPVSGARGSVRRWDHGDYEALPVVAGETLRVRLAGRRLRGIVVLKEDGMGWLFVS